MIDTLTALVGAVGIVVVVALGLFDFIGSEM